MARTRQLLLLRHAKSSWLDPALEDFDRPLAGRGLDAAPMIGREIARRSWVPQKGLVSPALRTRDTWRLVAAEWTVKPDVEFAPALYAASAEEILEQIRRTARTIAGLLVVGHNPGLEDLANRLASNRSDAAAIQRLASKFPTGALARFEVEGDWQGLRTGTSRLTDFVRPRDL